MVNCLALEAEAERQRNHDDRKATSLSAVGSNTAGRAERIGDFNPAPTIRSPRPSAERAIRSTACSKRRIDPEGQQY
jgi:hypothetical protein